MSENPSNFSKWLKLITPDVEGIHLTKGELTPEILHLIDYLSNSNLPEGIWEDSSFPKYIFAPHFQKQITILITQNRESEQVNHLITGKKFLTIKDLSV